MRRAADAGFDKTGGIDRDDHRLPSGRDLHSPRRERRTPVAGAFGEGRKAEAEITTLSASFVLALAEAGYIDGLDRQLQRLLVGRLVIFEAHGGLVRKAVNQIAPAYVDRVEAAGSRRLVHQPLDREGD